MSRRSTFSLAVPQRFTHEGRTYTYVCGRFGRGRHTRRHYVEVFDSGTLVATCQIAWNIFNGSPLSYKDYGLSMLKARLRDPLSVASQCANSPLNTEML